MPGCSTLTMGVVRTSYEWAASLDAPLAVDIVYAMAGLRRV